MAAAYCLRPCPYPAKALFLSWALLIATAVLARTGPPQIAGSSDAPTYTLRGTVANSVTGDPIRRVLVQAGPYAQLTDAQGRFEFTGLSAGQFSIGVQKPGFFTGNGGGGPATIVDVGPKTPDAVIKLIPEGIIFGHLTDENGEPMEDVFVHVRGWRVINGRRQLQETSGQSTDEEGNFRLFGLMPGTYYLQTGEVADRGAMQMLFSAGRGGYPSSYFPGVRQLNGATPIQVAPGQKVQADFSLRRISAFQVSGQVTLYPGGRVTMLQLMESSDRSSTLPVDLSFGNGAFIARVVPAGSYSLTAMGVDEAGHPLFGEKAITVASNLTGVVVSMAATVSIPVVVQTEFSGSSEVGKQPPVQVYLRSIGDDEQNYLSQEPQPGRDNIDRGLVLPSVQPGRYYAAVQPQGNWYVESMASGSTDLFRETLTVGSGTQVAPIRVVLRDDGASLAGVVRFEGEPLSASVLVIMQDEPLRVPQMLMADRQGAFQIENLPPGDYVVLAFDNTAELEYANRDALRDYFSQGTRITLGPKDAATVNLNAIHR
jgi:hypothetical protein